VGGRRAGAGRRPRGAPPPQPHSVVTLRQHLRSCGPPLCCRPRVQRPRAAAPARRV
jgi:hypothetical protein